jgi:hypothetical protein
MTVKCCNCEKELPDELRGTYCPRCGYPIGSEVQQKSFWRSRPVLAHIGIVCLVALMVLPFFVLLGSLVESWKVFWAMPLAVAIIETVVIGLEFRPEVFDVFASPQLELDSGHPAREETVYSRV